MTKPLGTGVIAASLKRDLASEPHVAGAVNWMLRLNRAAAQILGRFEAIRACTDVTGYGLLGHASEMAEASGACLELDSVAVPLMSGAMKYSAADLLPGGADRKRASNLSLSPPARQSSSARRNAVAIICLSSNGDSSRSEIACLTCSSASSRPQSMASACAHAWVAMRSNKTD